MSVSDIVVDKEKLLPAFYKVHPRRKLQHKNKPQKNLSEEKISETPPPKSFRPPGGVGLFPQNFDVLQARSSLKKTVKTENTEQLPEKVQEEVREKVAVKNVQEKVTEDVKEKVAVKNVQEKVTEDVKEKVAVKNVQEKVTEDVKEKVAVKNVQEKVTEDVKEKVAEDQRKVAMEDLREKASELEKEKKKFNEEKMEFEQNRKKMREEEAELQTKKAEFEKEKQKFETTLKEFKVLQDKFDEEKKKFEIFQQEEHKKINNLREELLREKSKLAQKNVKEIPTKVGEITEKGTKNPEKPPENLADNSEEKNRMDIEELRKIENQHSEIQAEIDNLKKKYPKETRNGWRPKNWILNPNWVISEVTEI